MQPWREALINEAVKKANSLSTENADPLKRELAQSQRTLSEVTASLGGLISYAEKNGDLPKAMQERMKAIKHGADRTRTDSFIAF